jgi:hypothetical protein
METQRKLIHYSSTLILDRVDELKQMIVTLTKLAHEDILLLYEGQKLERGNPLKKYGCPSVSISFVFPPYKYSV